MTKIIKSDKKYSQSAKIIILQLKSKSKDIKFKIKMLYMIINQIVPSVSSFRVSIVQQTLLQMILQTISLKFNWAGTVVQEIH